MMRYFPMTDTAKQATWCKLSTGQNFIPSQWLIDGDKSTGYVIMAVDGDSCGFTLITLKSLYAAKLFMQQVNNTGKTDFEKYCQVGAFAWRNYPIPENNSIPQS